MITFSDVIARTLPGNRIREIASAAMLAEKEQIIFFEYCTGNKNRGQIADFDFITERQQKAIKKALDIKLQLWYYENLQFFSNRELHAINKALIQIKKDYADDACSYIQGKKD